MYRLFPKGKAYLALGCAVTFLFVGALMHDGARWHVAAAAAVCGVSASWLLAELYAAMQHHTLLLILHRLLQPREFIKRYGALLEERGLRPRVRLTLLAYLSNGYAALGDFARAEQLLAEASNLPCAKQRDCLALLAGNRCAINLARGDTLSARKHLENLLAHIDEMPPGKKRRAYDETKSVLGTCLAIHERRCSHGDTVFLERRLTRNWSALYRLNLEFWLARAHLALDEYGLAEPLLERVSAAGGELWVREKALELIKAYMPHEKSFPRFRKMEHTKDANRFFIDDLNGETALRGSGAPIAYH